MKESGMSEIVGAIVLVALVVAGLGMIGVFMTSNPPPEEISKAVLSGACTRCPSTVGATEGESQYYAIMISHEGGESVDPATLRFFVDTKEKPGEYHEVLLSDFFDSSEQDLADLQEEICIPPNTVGKLIPKSNMESLDVGDAARIWFNMEEYDWQKPRGVQIWTADKRYETSLKVPEFRAIDREEEFDDPVEYTEKYGDTTPPESGGTGGTGQPSEPGNPSVIVPVYVEDSVCKCGEASKGGGYCVAQFTYENQAKVEYTIPIKQGGTPWNEFTGAGMVEWNHCQPELFKAEPSDADKFWTKMFWNNIKWKLGHTQSALVKCDKKTPQCAGDQSLATHPCQQCGTSVHL